MSATGKQAILHIGDMKCGSTSIQHWIAQDADLLRANGIWRSDVTRVVHYDSRLSSYALNDDRLDNDPRVESGIFSADKVPAHRHDIERRLALEVAALPADARAMIFSHEMMLSLQPREVERLVTMLRGLFSGIRVVAYIRRQDRLFQSLWGQRLKSRDPGTDFLKRLLSRRKYLPMLEAWEQAVGRENMAVRIFDKTAFIEGDLQADFRAAAGIPADDRYSQPIRTNESLDAAAQTLLLELGERVGRRHGVERRRLWARLRRVFLRLSFLPRAKRRVEPPVFPIPLKNFLAEHRIGRGLQPDRSWAERVLGACAEENEAIRRRYFPEQARLFDEDVSEYPVAVSEPAATHRRCDPDVLRHPASGPLERDAVVEAYRFVLGREPAGAEADHACADSANIAHVYALLLAHSRAA